jgi:hypothetical protein
MQFIFFVPPNEELEGTLHPQKIGCTPKNEGKRVHVPPDEKTCGHTDEELEGTLHPQKIGCTPKMKVKGYMYPQMKKHVGIMTDDCKKCHHS